MNVKSIKKEKEAVNEKKETSKWPGEHPHLPFDLVD
jgi:hypothetical protein